MTNKAKLLTIVITMTNMMPSVALRQRLPAPHWAGGFGHSCKTGAEAMRRKVRGFFYALHFMVGGVLGGLTACRVLSPIDQPDTLPTAQSLVTSVGGLNPLDRSFK